MTRTVLLAPGSVTSFASARHPSFLKPGGPVMSLLRDVRLSDGIVRCRPGQLLINNAVDGTNEFRGAFDCVINGVPTIFAGYWTGSRVRIIKSVDVGVTWTVVSPSVGTYGDTTFPTDNWLYWALVTQEGTDILVIQNGVDDPRVYDGTTMAVSPPTTLVPVGTVSALFIASSDFSGVVTTPDSGGGITTSQVTNATGSYVKISVATTVASADYAYFSQAGGIVAVTGEEGQFAFLIDEPTQLWTNLKIEASLNPGTVGPWYTVFDPATTPYVTGEAAGTAILAGVSTLDNVPAGTILSLRFSYVGTAPTTAKTINLYLLANAGYLPGGTNYAAAYGSVASRAQGPGKIFTTVIPQVVNGIEVPLSPLIGYAYRISIVNPAVLPSYIDYVYFYRNDVGTTGYYYLDGNGVVPSTTTVYDDGVSSPPTAVDFTKPLPRADSLSLPIGGPMASINGRLFVGSGNRLYYSAAGRPFSFAQLVLFDSTGNPVDDSAGSFDKAGETFKAIVGVGQVLSGTSLGTPQNGSVNIYYLTDRSAFVSSGYDALSLNKTTKIAAFGSRSPYSVGVCPGGFYFLSSEKQICRVSGTDVSVLSKDVVDDQTQAIPENLLPMSWGCYYDGRFRLSYGEPGGASNYRIMVFDETNGFESIDFSAFVPSVAMLAYYDGDLSRTRILTFGTVTLIESEAPGQTLDYGGQRITPVLRFPEIDFGTYPALSREMAGVFDVDAEGFVYFSVVADEGTRQGSVPVTPLAVPLSANRTGDRRTAKRQATGVGADSLGVQPVVSLSCLGGTRIFRIEIGVDKSNADRAIG